MSINEILCTNLFKIGTEVKISNYRTAFTRFRTTFRLPSGKSVEFMFYRRVNRIKYHVQYNTTRAQIYSDEKWLAQRQQHAKITCSSFYTTMHTSIHCAASDKSINNGPIKQRQPRSL